MNKLIGKLLNPGLYAPPVASVELLETHISWVLLAGDYAYKIKKPVNFGFLDFSTLAKRRFYCHEELRLNRRLAANLYLEVAAIAGSMENPYFAASGEGIEYAVKMRRFEQDALFDRMLAENRLEAAQIEQLADTVAAFHGAIARSGPDDAHGLPADIQIAALDNFSHLYPLLPDGMDGPSLETLRTWTHDQYERLQAAMQLRKERGFVRECHGDLHLGNIVWLGNRAVPFDAIEFNEKLRWVDVASEIAFTAMDLQVHQRNDLAYRLLNRYFAATGDYHSLPLLRYYLVYRAMVRAKIAVLSLAHANNEQSRTAMVAKYRRQIDFALACIRPNTPLLLLCHGFSGSGKSTIAAHLAENLPALHLRSDLERKRLCGLAAMADSGSQLQGGIYTENITELTYSHLAALAEDILRSGVSVIVDATCLKRRQRDLFRNCAKKSAARLVILDIQTSESTLRQRIAKRFGSRLDSSEADIAVLEQQMRQQQPLAEEEMPDVIGLDGEHSDFGKLLPMLRSICG
jgi:aminoglycoside phosphotransferase family enzyme/predicted kinase